MFSRIRTGVCWGIKAHMIWVEVDISPGLPTIHMVGSLSGEVREAKDRVWAALKNMGIAIPAAHITVNLSPADIRKEGTALDLPIAVRVLEALELIAPGENDDCLFLGELGLNGEIKNVKGVLPIVQEAKENGVMHCILPNGNWKEGALVPGISCEGFSHLGELIEYLQIPKEDRKEAKRQECEQGNAYSIERAQDSRIDLENEENTNFENEIIIKTSQNDKTQIKEIKYEDDDFIFVSGQEEAKRAALIAAAGFHNLLMVGPPGAGKSMIAKRIPGILPKLDREESLEITKIMSVSGLLKEHMQLIQRRPFQSPHHSISISALTGGGIIPKPGVLSLAHKGVLFLDELPEFQRNVIDSLRQPLEDREVHIGRLNGNVTYPADAMLVCAMNPCPCGYYPDRNKCRCSDEMIKRYMGRVSGPILDRIDLCVELHAVDIDELQEKRKGMNSAQMLKMVNKARQKQKDRFVGTGYRFNSEIKEPDMERFCYLGEKEKACMRKLHDSLQFSARVYYRILKVARTMADLEGEERILERHLYEAAYFRPSQEYWV